LFPLHELDADDADMPDDCSSSQLRNPLLEPRTENLKTARQDEAHLIADQIEKLVNEPALISEKDENDEDRIRAIDFGDIMVLIRNRTHIGVYESVFRNRGIPFIGSQRGSLLDNQEIQDLERLLDSLITPFNNISVAQVLKSPVFAASDADLISLSLLHKDRKWYQRLLNMEAGLGEQHPLSRAARLLPRWHKLADTMPVHDLLDRIYAEGNIIQRYVSSVPPAQQQRVSANLQRFHELSLELDSGRYPGLSHFLHYLRSIRQHRDGSPDEPTIAHGQSCVNLMTIHASKGLESPVVILADCDNQGGHNNAYTALVDWPAESSKPVRFQLVTAKDNTDEITRDVLKQKEQAQKREELNLLYVALTRARQYLLVTGSASKSKSGWYEYIQTAMSSLTTADSDGAYHLTTGDYNGAGISKEETAETGLEIVVDTRLTRPIINIAATEHMIAPSLGFHASNESLHSAHDSEGTRRGTAIHRALDLMSRVPPLSAEQARQQIRQESELVDNDSELDIWMDEACKTVNNRNFEYIFDPSAYQQSLNELPVMYQHNKRSVYGIIDRLIINDGNILLIDYKTHQVDNEAELESLAETFQNQMQLYRTGVEKLWPGMKIKSGLLFTHSARLIWIDRYVRASEEARN
jgi:ATP-dependent helicase/nuclease subunit A